MPESFVAESQSSPFERAVEPAGPRVGAFVEQGGVTFRVWAPKHATVSVAVAAGREAREVPCAPDPVNGAGYFVGHDTAGQAGDFYRYRVAGKLLPDPASRFQPIGVEGPSVVVDPARYKWRANEWRRPTMCGRVIYELHVGTFSSSGTFLGALSRLDYLVDLGINTIELMPLGDFPGRWNWGYDGVMPFAPARCYGTPDELRALIDAAHQRRLAVVVDVVYNHLGPVGNVLPEFSDDYFHRQRESGWGAALNFDGPNSAPVRWHFLQNAIMWLDEYRVDGLRLDATHAIHDKSNGHIMADIAEAAAARGAFTIAEDERNHAQVTTPREAGGWGVDAVWADDFHHVVRVGLTGEATGYFANYAGDLVEWLTVLRDGWLYHGQHCPTWQRPRGTPGAHLPPQNFVFCISNHDQVGNRPRGDRLHEAISAEFYRAASMLLCFVPYTPMIFQGQEWAAATPFPFFSDLPGSVGERMLAGRKAEFTRAGLNFPADELDRMPDPQREATFRAAKLDWTEPGRAPHSPVHALYRECLRLRAAQPVFQSCDRSQWSVLPLAEAGFALRWNHPDGAWALVVALQSGVDFVAPDDSGRWHRALSSNEARFGGSPQMEMQGPGAVLWRTERRL